MDKDKISIFNEVEKITNVKFATASSILYVWKAINMKIVLSHTKNNYKILISLIRISQITINILVRLISLRFYSSAEISKENLKAGAF